MEFPDVGRYCAEPSCARLDFLPISCDACHKVFCSDHWEYDHHKCSESYSKDVQVPVCPLCGQPVPVKRGEDPNREVDIHIQGNCASKRSHKIPTYKCSHRGCKSKEMVQVKCASCHSVFCIRHRLEANHNCQGTRSASKSPGSNSQEEMRSARLKALGQTKSTHTKTGAVARATPPSKTVTPPSKTVAPPRSSNTAQSMEEYDEDEALARAIAASLQDQDMQQTKKKPSEGSRESAATSDTCTLS